MAGRDDLSPLEQYANFKRAVETYQHYLQIGNFIGAYVIAFSMLEDRVNVMYATRYQLQEKRSLSLPQLHMTTFSRKVIYLLKQGYITSVERADWLKCATDRNRKLHSAMWNLDEFTRADAETVLQHVRAADRLRKAQKRQAGR